MKWIKFLTEEKHMPVWTIILGVLGIVVAIIALVLSIIIPWQIQSHSEEKSIANLLYAFTIAPAPTPGEKFQTTSRWRITLLISNTGPATMQAGILHLRTPDPKQFLHSTPEIASSPAAAEITVNERVPAGIYQIVIKNLLPGDQCAFVMFYRTNQEDAIKYQNEWSEYGLTNKAFGQQFINDFWFSGENIKVTNIGALNLEPTFKSSN